MNCKSCGIDHPEMEMVEGKCPGCYRDPEALPLVGVLGYIAVVLFLLVIICL